jgi:hypothetical protein
MHLTVPITARNATIFAVPIVTKDVRREKHNLVSSFKISHVRNKSQIILEKQCELNTCCTLDGSLNFVECPAPLTASIKHKRN